MKYCYTLACLFLALASLRGQSPYIGESAFGVNAPNPTAIAGTNPQTFNDAYLHLYNGTIGQTAGSFTMRAYDEVILHDRGVITPGTAGNFHAYIGKPSFSIYDMTGNWNPKKWERFEIGVSLPPAIDQRVENFLNAVNLPDVLNPYDPAQVMLKATFYKPFGGQIVRYGFYYRDIAITSGISYTASKSQQSFRIRLAPDRIDRWDFKIELYVLNTLVDEYIGHFTVQNSNRPGPLSIGNYNHLKYEDGTSFFAIGQDMGPIDHPNPPYCSQPILPADGNRYRGYIANLADYGGNFVRIPMDKDNFYLE